ncbi:Kynurenine--oxoglutarate transaminase 3 [Tetrabaena socialis]|uniref:Kynurenine--oxoglutarate transaminase 3 n=1 Tax=Tetrabaena socialis TaxID=47790 RepID=A0A2J8AE24_9CHLO|nr:Kynurenine--oxoglutarate transaminase 3 [Tetrabaena socialis]|eukprot:PNH10775.1 Kynurenine--oxoglutarate transaminase 3 [Tetrabaena socialis]
MEADGATPSARKPLNELFCSLPTTIFEVMSKLGGAAGTKRAAAPPRPRPRAPPPMSSARPAAPDPAPPPHTRAQGIPVDWASETLVTVGATEGLAAAFLGLLNPGDEVVMFDPMYDSYVSMARRAGAVIVPVRLALPDLSVPLEELAAAVGPHTKMIMLNSPHNPSGKVFSLPELEAIAELCIRHDVIALCDEVYEHLVFGGAKHISLRSLPGMAERAVRLGSAGKTFSFTAWKVSGARGGLHLHPPLPSTLGPSLEVKRRYLEGELTALGFGVLPAHGAYFLITDISKFLLPGEDDVGFAKRLTVEGGVTTIPVSGFYVGAAPPTHLVRFCYCKEDPKLQAAVERLRTYLGPGGKGSAQ